MCASSNHRASFVRSLSAIHLDPIVNQRQRSLSPSSSCDSSQKSSTKRARAVTPPSPTIEPPSNQKHVAQHEEANKFKTKLQPKKQSTSTSSPGRRRRSSATVSLTHSSASVTKGFRADYEIGESIRSPQHMLTHSLPEQAARAFDSLQKHDFAFIKRRDGTYTYAILAKRTENSLTFVVCKDGYVKKVGKKNWNELICSVAIQR